MTGVDPFTQPGVERYKQEAREEIRRRAEKNSHKDE
jgi:glucose-6-phosphate isomerase